MSPFDLKKYRRPSPVQPTAPAPKKLPRRQSGEWFLKGPIPGWWLGKAATLSGRSLNVALAIWHEVALAKKPWPVLRNKTLAQFGVSRSTAYAGLKRLEAAGLVRVDRHNGRRPRVTVCDRKEHKA